MRETLTRWSALEPVFAKRHGTWRRFLPWNWFVRLPGGSFVWGVDFLRFIRALMKLEKEKKDDAILAFQILCSLYWQNDPLVVEQMPQMCAAGLIERTGHRWYEFAYPRGFRAMGQGCLCAQDGYPDGLIEPWAALA